MAGKHQGEWDHCQTCGRSEDRHNVRHPFVRWRPGRGPTTFAALAEQGKHRTGR